MKPDRKETIESPVLPVVSVIVITYNQDLSKIIQTLNSVVIQENIAFEAIICDDGSRKRYEKELKNYFSRKNFCQYRLIFHDHNNGTVLNYYSGLKIAKGKYTMLISPGDCLVEKRTLYKWVRFLEENNANWSFSDAFYYHNEDGKIHYYREKAWPQLIRPYVRNDRSRCIWNYCAMLDSANGASIIGLTHLQISFCKILIDGGIKYCEDYMYRLMMFDGIVGWYYTEPAICYEYGTGVSTSGNLRWKEKLTEDSKKLVQILREKREKSEQQKKILNAMIRNYKTGKIGKLWIRGKLLYWIKWHFFPRLTPQMHPMRALLLN